MAIRINPTSRRVFPALVTGTLLKIIGIALTIQATVGVAILGRSLLHLEAVSDQAQAQVILSQGDGLGVAWMLLCRMGGTAAALIFAVLAITGYHFSIDLKKYAARVGLTALISEIPYDLCINGTWFSFQTQNPLFAIAIGILVLYLVDEVISSNFGRIGVMALGLLAAALLNIEYAYLTIGTMYIYYFLDEQRSLRLFLVIGLSCTSLLLTGLETGMIGTIVPAAFAMLLLFKYNEDAPQLVPKWLSYGIYPLHYVVIAILCMTVFSA